MVSPTLYEPETIQSGPDATAEFYRALNDKRRWIIREGVPIFKSHVRKDPATGNEIRVDLPKLYRIADRMARQERDGGVPIRMTLGHTEPGKAETEQPPVGGYYRNPRVGKFGPKGEPAVIVDEWLDPAYAGIRKNFPYRSAEYYDDAEQITGVALLTRDPYLDLGVVAYSRSLPGPVHYARGSRSVPYQFMTQGDAAMWSNPTPNPHGAYNGSFLGDRAVPPTSAPRTEIPTQYSAPQAPLFPGAPNPQATPTPAAVAPPGSYTQPQQYVAPEPTPYGWQGGVGMPPMDHQMGRIGQTHTSTGAIYQGYQPAPRRPMRPNYGPRPYAYNPRPQRPYGGYRGPGRYADDDDDGPPPPSGGSSSGGDPSGMPPGMDEGPGGPPPDVGMGGPPGGPMGGMGGGPDENALQTVYQCLMQATEALGRALGTGGPPGASAPPTSPFPPGGGGGGPPGMPPTPNSRYGDRRRPAYPTARRYSSPGRPVNYNQPPAQQPERTISGYPVGYRAEVENLKYQNAQLGQAVQYLMAKQDASDSDACGAEIARLAAAGYPVGDYEFGQLKALPAEQRAGFLQHIQTKYARVPVGDLPPILGDPTPAPPPGQQGPATKEEMDAALKLTRGNPDPNSFTAALQYIRSGGNPSMYGQPQGVPPGAVPGVPQGPGVPMLQFPADPYAPSTNGHAETW